MYAARLYPDLCKPLYNKPVKVLRISETQKLVVYGYLRQSRRKKSRSRHARQIPSDIIAIILEFIVNCNYAIHSSCLTFLDFFHNNFKNEYAPKDTSIGAYGKLCIDGRWNSGVHRVTVQCLALDTSSGHAFGVVSNMDGFMAAKTFPFDDKECQLSYYWHWKGLNGNTYAPKFYTFINGAEKRKDVPTTANLNLSVNPEQQTTAVWGVQSTIGFVLDLNALRMEFYLNGKYVGDIGTIEEALFYYPAIYFGGHSQYRILEVE